MEKPIQKQFNGFPSDLLDPSVKAQKKYILEYIKAFHDENRQGHGTKMFRNAASNYQNWRDLARGKQSVDRYKPQLGVRKGRQRKSFKSLDWSILPIAPKFVNLLVGKIMNRNLNLSVKTIDKHAKSEQQEFKNKLKVHLALQKELKAIEQATGQKIPMPVEEGMPMPANQNEIDAYVDMFFRDELAMEFHDILQKSLELSDNKQIEKEVVEELIEVGVAAIRSYIDSNGMIRHRRCVPERIITNNVKFEDFRDLTRVGEYIELTIAELKTMAGNQFTEEEYKKIAENATNKSYGNSAYISSYYDKHQQFPYDRDRVMVLDAEWFSADRYVYQVKPNRFGNQTVFNKNRQWWDNLKITPEQYSEQNPGRKVMFEDISNVYIGMWIVDTDFVFNAGLKTDMSRAVNNVADTMLGYTMYTTKFDSIIRMIEPILHNIQINWLQYQNHVARSRPSGLEIEMSAMEGITLGQGQKMSPKEALQLYMDTGILVWRRKNWSAAGNQWRPIQELQNGISDAADKHLIFITQGLDLLRSILGVNEATDSSTPNPELGKAVAQLAAEGTNNALYYLWHGHKKMLKGMALQTAMQIPAMINKAKRGMNKGIMNIFGEETINFFSNHNDLNLREMGIEIHEGIDREKKERIAMYVQRALDKQELLPEDALEIEEENNLHRAAYMLRVKSQQRARQREEEQMRMYEAEMKKNQQSAVAAAEAKKMEIMAESEAKLMLEERLSQLRMQEEAEKVRLQIILKKLESNQQLTELEEQRVTDLMKVDRQGEWNLRVAKARSNKPAKAS